MNISPRWAVLAAAVWSLSYLVPSAPAQPPAKPANGTNIALIDVSYVFKNHARFKGMMEDMRAEADRATAQVKAEREAIQKLSERLSEYHKGTPDYQQMEEELAKRQANLAVNVKLRQNEFLQREAKIYNGIYQEIWQTTDYFCKQNKIDVVINFNSENVDVDRPDSVWSFVNKPVVWYARDLNITDQILQELNRTSLNPAAAQQRGAAVPRQGVPFR